MMVKAIELKEKIKIQNLKEKKHWSRVVYSGVGSFSQRSKVGRFKKEKKNKNKIKKCSGLNSF